MEAIKRCLLLGARVIELDIFCENIGDKLYDPIVVHGAPGDINNNQKDLFTTSSLKLEDCFETIL